MQYSIYDYYIRFLLILHQQHLTCPTKVNIPSVNILEFQKNIEDRPKILGHLKTINDNRRTITHKMFEVENLEDLEGLCTSLGINYTLDENGAISDTGFRSTGIKLGFFEKLFA